MTLLSYQILKAVADMGSFNKAAEVLGLTPSAVSHSVAALERELGFALFTRSNRGVMLTEAGECYYKGIKSLVQEHEELLNACIKKAPKAELLRVGYYSNGYLRRSFSMMVANAMRSEGNASEIRACRIELGEEERMLRMGKIDVCTTFDSRRFEGNDLNFEMLKKTGFFCILPSDMEGAKKTQFCMEDLKGKHVILPRYGLFRASDELLETLSLDPQVKIEDVVFESSTIDCALMERKIVINFGEPGNYENALIRPFIWKEAVHGVLYRKGENRSVGLFIDKAREFTKNLINQYYTLIPE